MWKFWTTRGKNDKTVQNFKVKKAENSLFVCFHVHLPMEYKFIMQSD